MYYHTSLSSTGLSILLYKYTFCTHSYENNYGSVTKIIANPFKHLTLSTHFESIVMQTLFTLWQEKFILNVPVALELCIGIHVYRMFMSSFDPCILI